MMATGLLGHLEQFDPALEEWPQYVERLEQFFVANDITGDGSAVKKRATFLAVVGRSAYNLLRSLIAPARPAEKTFEELVEVLTAHYSPRPTEVMQRFRFNSRAKKEGESIADYVAALRKLAEFCNYGVRGMNDSPVGVTPRSFLPKVWVTPPGINDSPMRMFVPPMLPSM